MKAKAFEKEQGSFAVIGNSRAKLQALFYPFYCKQLGLTRVMVPWYRAYAYGK
jgi:hypothetical protein